jgi:hypothetical protein
MTAGSVMAAFAEALIPCDQNDQVPGLWHGLCHGRSGAGFVGGPSRLLLRLSAVGPLYSMTAATPDAVPCTAPELPTDR